MPRRFRNTRRENRLEELGRVDAERAHTSKGKRNLREEKDRIRSELATGGRAATRPMTPDQKRKPSRSKTRGGGPDSGTIGKIKDMISKYKDVRKGLGKKAGPSPEDLKRIKDKMPKKYPPKREMQPLRKGGSAVSKGGGITHKPQSGIGPSKKSQKKYYDKQRDAAREMNMSGRGKQFRDKTFTDRKTGRTVPDTKRNRERYGKDRIHKSKMAKGGIAKKPRPHGPHMWVKGDRVKKRGGGLSQTQQHYVQHGYGPYKSSGKVLKGKKIGIQIK